MISRLLFTCAYDGTPYRGWQSQAGGGTVQDTIEAAATDILRQPLRIAAAGRTDAGVHAEAQCFHADVPDSCRMSPENWQAAMNAHLPATIRICGVRRVEPDFHARFSAAGKIYEYLICRAPVQSPFLYNRSWHVPHPFDVDALEAALKLYTGEHDFRRFAANRGNEPDDPPPDFYLRTIHSTDVQREGELLRLRFCGNGFMYRMVRMLTGTAHRVATGRMSPGELESMLTCPTGPKTRFCAPACGLYLHRVLY